MAERLLHVREDDGQTEEIGEQKVHRHMQYRVGGADSNHGIDKRLSGGNVVHLITVGGGNAGALGGDGGPVTLLA